MIDLLCTGKARNNEEYKKVIKLRMNLMILVFVAGILTLAISLFAKNVWEITISDYQLGVYTGIGVGAMLISVILWIKNRLLLADEEKIKISRLKRTDERLQEINQIAFRIAASILLVVLYVAGLIAGLFYPFLYQIIIGIEGIFVLSYLIAYKVLEKRM